MLDFANATTFQLQLGWVWIALLTLPLALWLSPKLWRAAVVLPGYAVTPRLSRWLAGWFGSTDLDEARFLRADGAPERFAAQRKTALALLREDLESNRPESRDFADSIRNRLSDLRFADANRVPFPFAKLMRERFNVASVAHRSVGPYLEDLDGQRSLDVSGSYGVNVAGYDRYKEWLDRGWERVRDLGPVLGPLHPVVLENVRTLAQISNKEEVSFHCSGTEAVMAAVRLARFNTGRKTLVCFSGAYHGWWDGVQPGIGSERRIDDVLTLTEMKAASLNVIRRRAHEIAGVLVNPVQSFHPNTPPPNDAVLLASEARKTERVIDGYGSWLAQLREVCTEAGVPLIFDEVYSGFRMAPGGAQSYFNVQADMVVYGKTVAAGLPIGVVCGPAELMRRFDPNHPMRIAYVVGTFAAYPHAMGTMREFLDWVTTEEADAQYRQTLQRTENWVRATNTQFKTEQLPVQLNHLGTIWTIEFSAPSRFNWLLQYYLRAEGINLSWVGTGRCLISLGLHPGTLRSAQRSAAARSSAHARR